MRSREIRLRARPLGEPTPGCFELAETTVPDPSPGEVTVRNTWMSVDPYMRGRMNGAQTYSAFRAAEVGDAGYTPPLALSDVMQGGAVGEVVASRDPALREGDLVQSMFGWREAFTAPSQTVSKLPATDIPPQAYLGVAGMPGLTAYVGLLKIAAMGPGDIVFVSAASGAVGQIVCQIAKLKGHVVIGSAGGPEKGVYLRSLGVDHVVDYRAEPDLVAALRRASPKGIDIYFEHVGGRHLEAALEAARPFARFALCGMISEYNLTGPGDGVRGLMLAVGKKLRLEGFVNNTHPEMEAPFYRDMIPWIREGKIRWRETVEDGIENAPAAFLNLFSGQNLGKQLVRLT
jgi:NADPH-dependent curcumin reductase CurA